MEELRLPKLELHNQSYKGKSDESKLLNALTEALPPCIKTQALNICWLGVATDPGVQAEPFDVSVHGGP